MSEPAIDLDALGRLSVAERTQLVEDLWDFIARETPDESLPLSPELAAELDHRMADVASAREKTYNWDEVKEHILKGRMHGPPCTPAPLLLWRVFHRIRQRCPHPRCCARPPISRPLAHGQPRITMLAADSRADVAAAFYGVPAAQPDVSMA